MPKKKTKARRRHKPKARGGRPISETCMAPGCENPATSGKPPEFRRYVTRLSARKRTHYLHVCRGCWDRWHATGSFKRQREVEWDQDDELAAVRLRRAGYSASEIRLEMPHIPRRTLYDMFARAGLTSKAG